MSALEIAIHRCEVLARWRHLREAQTHIRFCHRGLDRIALVPLSTTPLPPLLHQPIRSFDAVAATFTSTKAGGWLHAATRVEQASATDRPTELVRWVPPGRVGASGTERNGMMHSDHGRNRTDAELSGAENGSSRSSPRGKNPISNISSWLLPDRSYRVRLLRSGRAGERTRRSKMM